MAEAILLMVCGAAVLVAAVRWRLGAWQASARWVARNVSVPALVAAPLAGLFLIATGLTVLDPRAILLAFPAALAFAAAMIRASRTGSSGRVPSGRARPRPRLVQSPDAASAADRRVPSVSSRGATAGRGVAVVRSAVSVLSRSLEPERPSAHQQERRAG